MTYIITRVLLNALALLLAAYLIPGILVDNIYIAIIAAILLGLLNLTLKPILFVLTLPITILTLGLFAFVLNAFIFLFVASFVDGFDVDGFVAALLGSLVVSVVSAVGGKMLSD
ncbi:MAG: phage holin family protein [Candidatus Paceibacterota bacterium]